MKRLLFLLLAAVLALDCTAVCAAAGKPDGQGTEIYQEALLYAQEDTEGGTEAPLEAPPAEGTASGATGAGEGTVSGGTGAGEGAASGGTEVPPVDSSLGISAPSVILMEASTGTVIAEKNAHEKLPPASVTKIMTLLLIFDNLGTGKIKLEDSVMTSAHAASMGGSQVYLEEGETQTVDTMIKCISVASANDASVAYQ